jgi:hypothetical protein
LATPKTISRFGRTYEEFDPDGGGGGPATWILSTSGNGSGSGTGGSSLPSGVYTPAVSAPAMTGMALYFTAPNTLDLAVGREPTVSGAPAPYMVVGLANADATTGQAVGLISDGQLSKVNWTDVVGARDLVPGARYYLSAVVPGMLQSSCPTAPGTIVVAVGQALSERALEVEINLIARL